MHFWQHCRECISAVVDYGVWVWAVPFDMSYGDNCPTPPTRCCYSRASPWQYCCKQAPMLHRGSQPNWYWSCFISHSVYLRSVVVQAGSHGVVLSRHWQHGYGYSVLRYTNIPRVGSHEPETPIRSRMFCWLTPRPSKKLSCLRTARTRRYLIFIATEPRHRQATCPTIRALTAASA